MVTRAQQGHAVFHVGNYAIPAADPQWNYQINSIDRHRCNHMTNYLKEGMKKLTVKSVNYEKVKEVQQGPNENPEVFQERLEETFRSIQMRIPFPRGTDPLSFWLCISKPSLSQTSGTKFKRYLLVLKPL